MMRVEIRLSAAGENEVMAVSAAISNHLVQALNKQGLVVHSFAVEEEDA
jgi:hypothetical protein